MFLFASFSPLLFFLLAVAQTFLGWWKEHKDLPTVDQEVKNVWNFDLENPTKQQKDPIISKICSPSYSVSLN